VITLEIGWPLTISDSVNTVVLLSYISRVTWNRANQVEMEKEKCMQHIPPLGRRWICGEHGWVEIHLGPGLQAGWLFKSPVLNIV
jgi:hypothetical protein